MASKVSRATLIAGLAVGACGLVAVPAQAANNYVTQPVVTGVSSLTPSSATVTGAIDTGGDPASSFTAATTSPFTVGGLSITASGLVNGIPLDQGFYSTVLFEADPLSDYVASGDQPGAETVNASTVEVPTATGLTSVSAKIGAYPASSATTNQPLTPNTKYVYWIVQQAGESQAATTINEYSGSDLAAWTAGTGSMTANGFASSSSVTNTGSGANDVNAWLKGTGKFAGDPGDPNNAPGQLTNPDWQCVLNSAIATNTNSTWLAELAANKVPLAAGSSSVNGTATPWGINAIGAGGSVTATGSQQPAEQGPCVAFFGGNSTNFYTSVVGHFTTPKLGSIAFGPKASVARGKAAISIANKSALTAAGQLVLTAKSGKKTITVLSGKISVPASVSETVNMKLSGSGAAALAAHGSLSTQVKFTATTDQPGTGKTIVLSGGKGAVTGHAKTHAKSKSKSKKKK